jgi:hypothetical protein
MLRLGKCLTVVHIFVLYKRKQVMMGHLSKGLGSFLILVAFLIIASGSEDTNTSAASTNTETAAKTAEGCADDIRAYEFGREMSSLSRLNHSMGGEALTLRQAIEVAFQNTGVAPEFDENNPCVRCGFDDELEGKSSPYNKDGRSYTSFPRKGELSTEQTATTLYKNIELIDSVTKIVGRYYGDGSATVGACDGTSRITVGGTPLTSNSNGPAYVTAYASILCPIANATFREATENWQLRNIRFEDTGLFNTKRIRGDLVNSRDVEMGFYQEGISKDYPTFEYSLFYPKDDRKAFLYVGCFDDNWSYRDNIELNQDQLSSLVRILGGDLNLMQSSMDPVISEVDQKPGYAGGLDAVKMKIDNYLKNHNSFTPPGYTFSGVVVEFIVEKDGSVTDPRIVDSGSMLYEIRNEYLMQNITSAFLKLDKFEPAKVDSLPVRYSLKVIVDYPIEQ